MLGCIRVGSAKIPLSSLDDPRSQRLSGVATRGCILQANETFYTYLEGASCKVWKHYKARLVYIVTVHAYREKQ